VTGRAVVIESPGSLEVVPAVPAAPGAGEALVRVAYAGICGSDREVYAGHRPAPFVRYPVVPGHEWSGTVAAVGAGVDTGLVGRKVVGEGFRNCQTCANCRRGDNNLCDAPYDETGFTQPGAWSDHLLIPARLLHTLPADADLRAAAGLEPAACIAAACLKVDVQPGERVAVLGGGMLGLLTVQLLRAVSPALLTLVHTRTSRAELARRCGADELITPDQVSSRAGGYDAVVEAAGARGTALDAVRLARRGGRVALTGIAASDEPIPPGDLVLGEITVHTVFGAPSRAWAHAVRAFAAGVLDPGVLVTHEVPLDDPAEAFRILTEERPTAVKVLLRP
jgi:2-desacetyl-2-hydroxyethyl bacteriochlorophyllide A dehydrogenase